MRDEKLAAASVRPIECHTHGASQVWTLIQLVSNRVARPAFAVPSRISSLDHEVRHNAMDHHVVEKTLARQRHEILNGLWRIEHGHLELNRPSVRIDVGLRRILRADEPGS